MSKTHTHTPGPWRVGVRATDDNTLPIGAKDKLPPLAHVSPRPFYDDQQEANARLIAAAPDLLAFVQDVARCGYTVNRDAAVQITNDARALIARIEVQS